MSCVSCTVEYFSQGLQIQILILLVACNTWFLDYKFWHKIHWINHTGSNINPGSFTFNSISYSTSPKVLTTNKLFSPYCSGKKDEFHWTHTDFLSQVQSNGNHHWTALSNKIITKHKTLHETAETVFNHSFRIWNQSTNQRHTLAIKSLK